MPPFWLLSVRGGSDPHQSYTQLKERTSGLASCTQFSLPDLRVGTLDSLMSLSDDLAKQDIAVEQTTRKIARVLSELAKGGDAPLKAPTSGSGADRGDLAGYMQHFEWDAAVYPTKSPLRELSDKMSSIVSRADEELKVRLSDYTTVKNTVAAHQRRTSGSLLVRSLEGLVKPEDYCDTEHLTTLFVVVPKSYTNDWLASYERCASFVVPRSTKMIAEDGDYGLWTAVLFKTVVGEWKNAVQDRKFTVRDYKFDEQREQRSMQELKDLEKALRKKLDQVVRWCKTNFGECYGAWCHIKALRVFVESVLRYGLPVNFVASVVQLERKGSEAKLRRILADAYSSGPVFQKDLGMDDMAVGAAEFHPYVSLTMDIEFSK